MASTVHTAIRKKVALARTLSNLPLAIARPPITLTTKLCYFARSAIEFSTDILVDRVDIINHASQFQLPHASLLSPLLLNCVVGRPIHVACAPYTRPRRLEESVLNFHIFLSGIRECRSVCAKDELHV